MNLNNGTKPDVSKEFSVLNHSNNYVSDILGSEAAEFANCYIWCDSQRYQTADLYRLFCDLNFQKYCSYERHDDKIISLYNRKGHIEEIYAS